MMVPLICQRSFLRRSTQLRVESSDVVLHLFFDQAAVGRVAENVDGTVLDVPAVRLKRAIRHPAKGRVNRPAKRARQARYCVPSKTIAWRVTENSSKASRHNAK